jgi:tyrosine-specific transport protein
MSFKTVILGAFMVAGAAVGSGVLALPILTAGPGVLNVFIVMMLTLILSYAMSVVAFKMYAYYPHAVNAATVARDAFGRPGYWFSTVCNVACMGFCCAAYINAGGDLLVKTVLPIFDIHPVSSQWGMLLFCMGFTPIFLAGLPTVSRLNGLICIVKFFCLMSAIVLGVHVMDGRIIHWMPAAVPYIFATSPTLFCIWGMHMVLPLVLTLNQQDKRLARWSVIIGLFLPLLIYVGWIMLIFSVVPREMFQTLHTVGDVVHYTMMSPIVPVAARGFIDIFANITMLTAFLSIGFSLIAFILDALSWQDSVKKRGYASVLAFGLPLAIAVLFPLAFVRIYQQSNIFLIASALIPVAAFLKKEKTIGLYTVLLLGSLLIIFQILDDCGWLPIFT